MNEIEINDSELVAYADGLGTQSLAPALKSETLKRHIYGLEFRNKRGVFTISSDLEIPTGSSILVETNRGKELAKVRYSQLNKHQERARELEVYELISLASDKDLQIQAKNEAQELADQSLCMQKIRDFKLNMRVIRTERLFDNSRIIFYFLAPQKVDFRELVKVLASLFRARIELRQINSREHVAMMGAVGSCGRQTCCSSFLTKTPAVDMSMVDVQRMGKNPGKLNGVCGKLKCCISYEYDFYREALEGIPVKGSCVGCKTGKAVVVGVNVFKMEASLRLPDDNFVSVGFDELRKAESSVDKG